MADLDKVIRSDPRVIEAARQAPVARLLEKDEWKALEILWRVAQEKAERSLVRRLMGGEKLPDDEIAFRRGVTWGINWLLRQPHGVESRLERAIMDALQDAETEGG